MKAICRNIAFSTSGLCLLGADCVCKKNQLWLDEETEAPAASPVIETKTGSLDEWSAQHDAWCKYYKLGPYKEEPDPFIVWLDAQSNEQEKLMDAENRKQEPYQVHYGAWNMLDQVKEKYLALFSAPSSVIEGEVKEGNIKYLIEDTNNSMWYRPLEEQAKNFHWTNESHLHDPLENWTNDANAAWQFDTKEEAQAILSKIFNTLLGYKVTEHEFISSEPAEPKGEIPEEIMQWIEKQVNGFSFEGRTNWMGGAKAMYRKLTETKACRVLKGELPVNISKELKEKIRPYHNRTSFIAGVVELWDYLVRNSASINLPSNEGEEQDNNLIYTLGKQNYEKDRRINELEQLVKEKQHWIDSHI